MKYKYFLFWLPMIGLAFANAALRELVLTKRLSNLQAQQLSPLTLAIFCGTYISLIFPFLHIPDKKKALQLGLFWVSLTITFEIVLGRLMHRPWKNLFDEYNIFDGKTWTLFLLCLLFLPYILFTLKPKSGKFYTE